MRTFLLSPTVTMGELHLSKNGKLIIYQKRTKTPYCARKNKFSISKSYKFFEGTNVTRVALATGRPIQRPWQFTVADVRTGLQCQNVVEQACSAKMS